MGGWVGGWERSTRGDKSDSLLGIPPLFPFFSHPPAHLSLKAREELFFLLLLLLRLLRYNIRQHKPTLFWCLSKAACMHILVEVSKVT